MSKVYWVTAGSSLTVNGAILYGHIVSQSYSTVNLNCKTYGDLFINGNVKANGDINSNSICFGSPTIDCLMGKNV